MADLKQDLEDFAQLEMSTFMKLNMYLNALVTDQLQRYLLQTGYAEEPGILPDSSEREFAMRQLYNLSEFL